jgi:hypothetical protein
MIVLEGPDNCGKTTLARQISDMVNIPISHSGGPVKSKEEMHTRMGNLLSMTDLKIMDRIPCISEQIYGPIIRKNNPFEETTYLKDFLTTKHPLIIYCDIPEVILFSAPHKGKSHEDQEHISAVATNLSAIKIAYANFFYTLASTFPNTMYAIVRWDWTSRDLNHLDLLIDLVKSYRVYHHVLASRETDALVPENDRGTDESQDKSVQSNGE